ncbi:hypothetical protein LTR66_006858 [Elasticomyces elasticus]|nr:hypothetical protein LTR66_006858 [Elasticomyces elasticus]
MPTYPSLPWYSFNDTETLFPPRASRKRYRRQDLYANNGPVALPTRASGEITNKGEEQEQDHEQSESSTIAAPSEQETPATSQAPSEADTSQLANTSTPTTPASTPKVAPMQAHARRDTRTAIPIIPALPNIYPQRTRAVSASSPSAVGKAPQSASSQSKAIEAASGDAARDTVALVAGNSEPVQQNAVIEAAGAGNADRQSPTVEGSATSPTPSKPTPPKSWADLIRTKPIKSTAPLGDAVNTVPLINGSQVSKAASLGDMLKNYGVDNDDRIAFLEPRGLVNTTNMCYMNSILQILVFCIPFHNFLDQIGKRVAHKINSDTPLVDAMVDFMREFKTIDSAESMEKLRMRLKDHELEQYGEPLLPKSLYETIKRIPLFHTISQGRQEDAEEFLGFILNELHDECVLVTHTQSSSASTVLQANGPTSAVVTSSATPDAGWMEVGPKQKASITQTSGDSSTPSPITKIFGGKLRSEFRVPGKKQSVTLEPYKPLQLAISAPNVNNLIDALKGLTHSETLTGDFNSPRGATTATKQVFIETLPPVLIIHLKRFEYTSSGGAQKIWKKVGYPLDLELPKEVFTPARRSAMAAQGGLPKYRLISVVYHHGKSALGGHYTVDLRRQDGREWVRIDDTFIRRIRADEVAQDGAEEDRKILAAALKKHAEDQKAYGQDASATITGKNTFAGLDDEEQDAEVEKPWNEVNGESKGAGTKKWSAVANGGTATPSTAGKQTPRERGGVKDNKVAYILLYEKVRT